MTHNEIEAIITRIEERINDGVGDSEAERLLESAWDDLSNAREKIVRAGGLIGEVL